MTIDEAIERLKRNINDEARLGYVEFAEFFSQINKWLEELKYHKSLLENTKTTNPMYEIGYNKGIDDAVKVIEDSKSLYDNSRHSSMGEKDRLQNLIKKLKAGD